MANLVVGLSFPSMLHSLGIWSYGVYAVCNLLAVGFFSVRGNIHATSC